jgi:hypothetical protein
MVGADVTNFGVFNDADALAIGLVGLFSDSHAENSADQDVDTWGVGAYMQYVINTLAFSLSVTGTFSEADIEGMAGSTETDSLIVTGGVSNTFELENSWFVEPSAEFTYSKEFIEDAENGESLQLLGSIRVGTEIESDSVKIEPSVSAVAFSNIHVEPDAGTTDEGQLWLQAIARLDFTFSESLSAHVEGDVRGTRGDVDTTGVGANAGFRLTF